MNRKELGALVDTMIGAWQIDVHDRRSLYRTWWRYLADIPYSAALAALDARVIAGDRWAPRVGELRRAAIDRCGDPNEFWPDAEMAWQDVENRLEDANSGVRFRAARFGPDAEEAIGRAMRTAGTRNGYHKQAFIKAWGIETAEYEQRRYGLPENAPTVLPPDDGTPE